MGDRYEHVCSSCRYRATVSGALDAGMAAITETMACSSCRQVVDVLVARHERDGSEPPVVLRCPDCDAAAESLRSWRTGGACPRCPGTMSIDPRGACVMWD